MKKISKLTLHGFSQTELNKKEQNYIRGGKGNCTMDCDQDCPCLYEGPQTGPGDSYYGGSSTDDNQAGNIDKDFSSWTQGWNS